MAVDYFYPPRHVAHAAQRGLFFIRRVHDEFEQGSVMDMMCQGERSRAHLRDTGRARYGVCLG